MQIFIIKFIPKDDKADRVIHKVKMPDGGEKDFYRHAVSFNAFMGGKRKDATKKELETHRGGCMWAPDGLYSCTEWHESLWLEHNQNRLESLAKALPDVSKHDETKWPTVIHETIYDFYDYIGFDRKRRVYCTKKKHARSQTS